MTTAEMIAGMLIENTGRSILDSGGAYGRMWERNAGTTLADWQARPEATFDDCGGVTLDVFHYLVERVEYVAEEDAAFQEWATTGDREHDAWFPLATAWAREHGTNVQGWNTYNGEDCLSQILQGVTYLDTASGEWRVLLQIHGGCDARGGYTAPRIMQPVGEMGEHFPCDNADYTVACTACEWTRDVRNACDVTDREGCSAEMPDLEDSQACPDCGATLAAYAPYAY